MTQRRDAFVAVLGRELVVRELLKLPVAFPHFGSFGVVDDKLLEIGSSKVKSKKRKRKQKEGRRERRRESRREEGNVPLHSHFGSLWVMDARKKIFWVDVTEEERKE